MNSIIDLEHLREILHYEPDTGHLTWKVSGQKRVIGERVGCKKNTGYRFVKLYNKVYLEHRLIWYYVTGEWLDSLMVIDHINHVRDDNRWSNLRSISRADNSRNRTRKTTRIDEAGIWFCKQRQKYIAEITLNGKKVYQRQHSDIEEAINQRKAKLLELGFHPNHGDKS